MTKSPTPMTFRPDINGLRAIAVLAVVFCHFDITGFDGGYVGVDVFFVISGFLMTQIICTKLSKGQFSLIGFYTARARRIFPALMMLVTPLLIGGMLYLPPMDYKLFGWQALSALTFVSNIVFAHGGDYFDISSQEKWLLHTWSLSVEWQFYMLLPLCLMGLHRFKRGRFLELSVISVFALSLILSLAMTPLYPTDSFFLLPTRAWELLTGALVFFYGSRLSKIPRLADIGLAFILIAIVFYSDTLTFPGHWAILPVLGTAFVIAAKSKSILLSNKPAQFFGNISYSLYLWHWPVMVGAKYLEISFTPLHVLLFLCISVSLAKISFVFVEEPFRRGKKIFLKTSISGYAAVGLLSYLVFFFNGLPSRVPLDVQAVEAATQIKAPKHGKCSSDYKKGGAPPDCRIDADVIPSAIVWGDSHVNAMAFSLGESLTDAKRAAFLYSYAGCPSILGSMFATKWKKDQCKRIAQATYDKTISDSQIRDVFMVNRWSVYLHGYNEKGSPHPYVVFDEKAVANKDNLEERAQHYAQKIVETMCALTAHGKNVYILLPIPEMGRNTSSVLARSRLIYHTDARVDISVEEYVQRNAVVLTAFKRAVKECHVRILDPKPYLCDTSTCSGIRDGKSLYSDDDHLSQFGNSFVKPLFVRALQQR